MKLPLLAIQPGIRLNRTTRSGIVPLDLLRSNKTLHMDPHVKEIVFSRVGNGMVIDGAFVDFSGKGHPRIGPGWKWWTNLLLLLQLGFHGKSQEYLDSELTAHAGIPCNTTFLGWRNLARTYELSWRQPLRQLCRIITYHDIIYQWRSHVPGSYF